MLSVSSELVLNLTLAPSWVYMGHLLKQKGAQCTFTLNLRILSSISVPFTLVQVTNFTILGVVETDNSKLLTGFSLRPILQVSNVPSNYLAPCSICRCPACLWGSYQLITWSLFHWLMSSLSVRKLSADFLTIVSSGAPDRVATQRSVSTIHLASDLKICCQQLERKSSRF